MTGELIEWIMKPWNCCNSTYSTEEEARTSPGHAGVIFRRIEACFPAGLRLVNSHGAFHIASLLSLFLHPGNMEQKGFMVYSTL